jgi:glycosyltransferase involved in cell wall biosynthesis
MANVTLVSHSPLLSGAERMLVNLAVGLERGTRHRATVLIPEASLGPMPATLASAGIKWQEAPATRWYLFEDSQEAAEYARHVLRSAEAYADLYWQTKADVVVVNTLTNLEAPLGARMAGLPYILWVHGILDPGQIRRFEWLKTVADGIALESASRIVCCSSWTESHFRLLARPGIVSTIPNWTDFDPRPIQRAASARFCVLSTLERHKGIDIVIQAVRLLRDSGIEIGVDVYGDGPLGNSLQDLTRRLGVSDLVAFPGRTSNAGLVYAQAFATIVPSQIEPFGMVAIESMAAGTPVIAARTGGLVDIVEDMVTGLHFTSGDANDLAQKIRVMRETPGASKRFAQAGRNRVIERYDGRTSLGEFDRMLRQVEAEFAGYREADPIGLNALRLLSAIDGEVIRPITAVAVPSNAERELAAIRASTYWRMGAPLRRFLSGSPRLRNYLRGAARLTRRALASRAPR